MLPMMLVLAFMYTVCMSIKSLVLEKELRLKEVLRGVGVQNAALWAASFTENLVLLALPCALISVMVKVSGGVPQGGTQSIGCRTTAVSGILKARMLAANANREGTASSAPDLWFEEKRPNQTAPGPHCVSVVAHFMLCVAGSSIFANQS